MFGLSLVKMGTEVSFFLLFYSGLDVAFSFIHRSIFRSPLEVTTCKRYMC